MKRASAREHGGAAKRPRGGATEAAFTALESSVLKAVLGTPCDLDALSGCRDANVAALKDDTPFFQTAVVLHVNARSVLDSAPHHTLPSARSA